MSDETPPFDDPDEHAGPHASDPYPARAAEREPTPAAGPFGVDEPRRPAQEDRTWAAAAHVAGVASSVFFPIIVSLVIYMVKKDESEFIADQAREALNFQITTALMMVAAFASVFCLIGFVLLPLVALASLVFALIGAIKAYDGERYRYPFVLRLI